MTDYIIGLILFVVLVLLFAAEYYMGFKYGYTRGRAAEKRDTAIWMKHLREAYPEFFEGE